MKRIQQSVFQLISHSTAREGVSCVLIGGFAINYYGVTRQTADVDFLITRDGFQAISSYLKDAGYKTSLKHENFTQLKGTKIPLMDVDFMFVDAKTLETILNEGKKIRIAQQEFCIPSVDHLIALKLHSIKYNPKLRLFRDLPDIINLIRINEIDVNSLEFKTLCLKYGTQELYEKIREVQN